MPLEWAGLGFHPWTVREVFFGSILGLGLATAAWIPIAILGGVSWNNPDDVGRMISWVLLLAAMGAGEEVLFRGYLFQRACELFGSILASFLFATLFAAVHFANPDVSLTAVLNTFLAGLFFCGLFLATRSLWTVAATHVSWNLMHALVAGVPVSGFRFSESLFRTSGQGASLLTGGEYGPEASIWSTAAIVMGLLILFRSRLFRQAPWSFARIFKGHLRHQRTEEPDIL
jgi:hypothetical protein